MEKPVLKTFLFVFCALLLSLALLVWASPAATTQALPEYAAQTGEPCSTCHASPSGGGPRTPRGQAWVAAGKSGGVPDLAHSLELLGVTMKVDPSYYTAVVDPPQAPAAVTAAPARDTKLYRWLGQYDGN